MSDNKNEQLEEVPQKRKPGRPKGSKNIRTLAEEKMLTNWQNSSMAPAMREDKAELNRAAGWFVAECWKMGQKVNKDSLDSLYDGLIRYVELCTQAGMPMLINTCLLALGMNNKTYQRWKNGTQKASDPRFKEFAEMLESVIGAGIEAAAAAGSIDRVLTIWWQKSHFNMIEGTGEKAENADPLGQRVSGEDIIKKYASLPD